MAVAVMSGALSCAGRRERRIVEPWHNRAVLKLSTSNTAPDYRLPEWAWSGELIQRLAVDFEPTVDKLRGKLRTS
jgi:hypothetical protein